MNWSFAIPLLIVMTGCSCGNGEESPSSDGSR